MICEKKHKCMVVPGHVLIDQNNRYMSLDKSPLKHSHDKLSPLKNEDMNPSTQVSDWIQKHPYRWRLLVLLSQERSHMWWHNLSWVACYASFCAHRCEAVSRANWPSTSELLLDWPCSLYVVAALNCWWDHRWILDLNVIELNLIVEIQQILGVFTLFRFDFEWLYVSFTGWSSCLWSRGASD